MQTRPIRFFHQGRIRELQGVPPTRSVLEWLREDAHCAGTKEGCAEGDCGACTVVLGELDAAGALQLRPVNACIQFVPTLDGRALFTVEDLAGIAQTAAATPLHPVQQAMVACHGSQCGFCTPGFVMSLWRCYEQQQAGGEGAGWPSRQALADALAGNLCRCTGYRPILDAAERMFALPPAPLQRQPVVQALWTLAQDPPLHTPEGFHAPRNRADLAALRQQRPQAQLLAGSTDIGLWVNKQLKRLPELIYIGRVAELQRIDTYADSLWIGAAVTLEAAWAALVRDWPALAPLAQRFAGPPVRHAGTMGGNVANGSPIGDSAPVLMALGAQLELQCGDALRRLPLEAFYQGYMRNALQPGEFVSGIAVPRPAPLPLGEREVLQAWKISKRWDCDISTLCGAFWLRLGRSGGEGGDTVLDARLAYGGMAATVARARQAEAALIGQRWNEATLQAAQAAIAQDFQPWSDLRASAGYRLQVAANLLRRLWLATRAENPLPAAALELRALP